MKFLSSFSYKTTLTGVASILAGLTSLVTMAQSGKFDTTTLTVALGLISAGVTGLVARDHSTSDEAAGVAPAQVAAVQAVHDVAATPSTTVVAAVKTA